MTTPLADASAMIVAASYTDMPLRVVFYNGHLKFFRAPPDEKYHDFRTFSYSKLAPYSKLITDAFQEHAVTPRYEAEDQEVESLGKDIGIHLTATMKNRTWRMAFFWELERENYRPGLDEPFRELLAMLENTNDALNDATASFNALTLPEIDGITKDVSILKLARLYWAARHLQLKAPLLWEKELRAKLLTEINNINAVNTNPAFRGVDFWYIWGAYRNLDNEVVDAMVAKLDDAITHNTHPKELEVLVLEGAELKKWMDKLKEKNAKLTGAQQMGGSMTSPPPLPHSAITSWRKSPTADSTVEKMTKGEQKTAPITILRKATEENATAENDNKKNKGEAYTAPTGMAPPPTSGTVRGKKRGHGNRGWRELQ